MFGRVREWESKEADLLTIFSNRKMLQFVRKEKRLSEESRLQTRTASRFNQGMLQ